MRARVALLVLLLVAPAAAAAEEDWQVFFTERRSVFHADGLLAEGETRGYRFVVAQQNVTSVSFRLVWRETGDATGVSGPDVLSLAASDPEGRPVGAPERSATGEARLDATLRAIPRDATVRDDELAALLAREASTRGQGEWRAFVKLEDAGNPAGASVDRENAYDLEVTIGYYEAVPMRVVSLAKPERAAGGGFAFDLDDPWTLATGFLGLAALCLAGVIGRQAWRRRASRVAPAGDNTASPDR